jgi:phosphate-selective porin
MDLIYAVQPTDSTNQKTISEEKSTIVVKYGAKGWEFSTADGKNVLQFQSRFQFRVAVPGDTDPIIYDDFQGDKEPVLKINRARLKIGGNAFEKWLKYYWEYELASGNLLDFRLMIENYSFFNIKIGQWKVHFNRERVISSGKQQMADRSLINRPFTIDRQQGVSFYGNLTGKGLLNFNYWLSIFTGTGRGSTKNDDSHLMYMIRTQWNFFGRVLGFEGSDTKFHKQPVGLIALAGATNRSRYTRFSQAGGGQLEGFEEGEAGQYRVNQFLVETAFMYRGFSWQQEFHWKEIDDKINQIITSLIGNYLQFGYFFHYAMQWVPKELEIAFRHAIYNPNQALSKNLQEEFSLDFNWFFKNHLNKLTAEISHFSFQENIENLYDGWRFRIQWDVSI